MAEHHDDNDWTEDDDAIDGDDAEFEGDDDALAGDDDDDFDDGPILVAVGDGDGSSFGEVPDGHRSGFVTLIGRPNAGKSTLINRMLGEKLAITSPKPQTTRDLIRGYLTRDDMQAILVDTPGFHEPKKGALLNRAMVGMAVEALDQVDVALLVVDAPRTASALGEILLPRDKSGLVGEVSEAQALRLCHRGDRRIIERLQHHNAKTIVVLNKRDKIRPAHVLPLMAVYGALPGVIGVIPVSARNGEGTDALLALVRRELPEGPRLVDPELLTDRSERFLCAELLREALFHRLEAEVPYRVAVQIEAFEEQVGLCNILAAVFVERPSQRGILLGKGGTKMREAATAARKEMAAMLGRRVYLEVHVRTLPRWTERVETLRRFGYDGGGAL